MNKRCGARNYKSKLTPQGVILTPERGRESQISTGSFVVPYGTPQDDPVRDHFTFYILILYFDI